MGLLVRGLYIAAGQYSSCGGCALGLMLGVLDIVGVEVRNREQVEVRENVEARETEEEDKTRNNKHVDEHVLCRHVVRHIEPQCDVCIRMKVSRKVSCEGVLSTLPEGVQLVNDSLCLRVVFAIVFRKCKSPRTLPTFGDFSCLDHQDRQRLETSPEIWC